MGLRQNDSRNRCAEIYHAFPEDFMFELTKARGTFKDTVNRRKYCDNSTLKEKVKSRYMPMAFTEQGVAMLSTVLNSTRAIGVNIAIMRAFVKMREILATNKEFSKKLKKMEEQLAEHDEQFHLVFGAIRTAFKVGGKAEKEDWFLRYFFNGMKN